eukprot:257242-Pelagomonas_calceolata.AAC.1
MYVGMHADAHAHVHAGTAEAARGWILLMRMTWEKRSGTRLVWQGRQAGSMHPNVQCLKMDA